MVSTFLEASTVILVCTSPVELTFIVPVRIIVSPFFNVSPEKEIPFVFQLIVCVSPSVCTTISVGFILNAISSISPDRFILFVIVNVYLIVADVDI